jgi:fructose-1,6-bisphosphatase/inositol monophosphatase family enzyme
MKEFLSFAETLADASRAIILEAVRKPFDLEIKGDGSPVTAVDQGVEDRLREMIAEAYPDHGIVGEERGASSPERELVWALDPIDGTLPFLAGIPVYGTLIALLRDRAPVLGVIEMPATAERWIGCQGRPTTRNGEPVTSNPDFYGAADVSALERLKAATRWTVYGGSCMAYAQIASGRIDVGIDVACRLRPLRLPRPGAGDRRRRRRDQRLGRRTAHPRLRRPPHRRRRCADPRSGPPTPGQFVGLQKLGFEPQSASRFDDLDMVGGMSCLGSHCRPNR